MWIIGDMNNIASNKRLDFYLTKTEEDYKTFILNHIKPKNRIITELGELMDFSMIIILIMSMKYSSWTFRKFWIRSSLYKSYKGDMGNS